MISENKLNNLFKQLEVIKENSPDSETKVSCIILNLENYSIVSTGYNGFIRKHKTELPTTRPDKHKYIIHAEMNAILNSAYIGTKTKDCIALVTLSPCVNCMRALYQSGIKTIIYKDEYKDFLQQLQYEDLEIKISDLHGYNLITLEPR